MGILYFLFRPKHRPLKNIEPRDFVLELVSHAKFVQIHLVKDFQKFRDQLLLADVLVLTVAVSCTGAGIINIFRMRPVFQLFPFFLG